MNCHIHFVDSSLWNGPRWDQQAYSCRTEEAQKAKWWKKEGSGPAKSSDRRGRRWSLRCQIFTQPHQQALHDLSNSWEKVFTATLVPPVVSWSLLNALVHRHWNTGVEETIFFPFILFKEQTDGYAAAYLVKRWQNEQLSLKFPTAAMGRPSQGNSYLIKIRKERQWSTVPGSNKN